MNKATVSLYGDCEECAKFYSNASRNNVDACMHSLTHRNRAAAGLRKVAATRDWPRFLRCVEKAKGICGHSSAVDDLWAAAMTLCYGPSGIHPSRLGPDGRPNAETLAMPAVSVAMKRAEERLPGLLYCFERDCVLAFAVWAGLASDGAFPALARSAA